MNAFSVMDEFQISNSDLDFAVRGDENLHLRLILLLTTENIVARELDVLAVDGNSGVVAAEWFRSNLDRGGVTKDDLNFLALGLAGKNSDRVIDLFLNLNVVLVSVLRAGHHQHMPEFAEFNGVCFVVECSNLVLLEVAGICRNKFKISDIYWCRVHTEEGSDQNPDPS